MRSYFCKLRIKNIDFDIVGDIEEKINGKWEKIPDINQKKMKCFENIGEIPIFSLAYELEVAKQLGEEYKAKIIQKEIDKQKNE